MNNILTRIASAIIISSLIICASMPMALADDTKTIHRVGWVSDDKEWEIPQTPLTTIPGTELKFTLKEPCLVHIQWNAEVKTGFVWDGKPFDNGYSLPGSIGFHLVLNGSNISNTTVASYMMSTTSAVIQDMRVLPAGEYTIDVHAMGTGGMISYIEHRYLTMTAFRLSELDEEMTVPLRPLSKHPNSQELIKNK